MNSTLNDIFLKHNTDKCHLQHDYAPKYETFFSKWRNEEFSLLEIGVFNGDSHRAWAEWFPNATIYGLDINPSCKQHETDRIKIEVGSQTDKNFLDQFTNKMSNLKIIIDDGSHIVPHQIASFEHLFPKLEANGFYVIEDSHTSYSMNGIYQNKPKNIFNYVFELNDHMHFNGKTYNDAWFANKKVHYEYFKHMHPVLNYYEKWIASIHLYKGIIFIEKDTQWWS